MISEIGSDRYYDEAFGPGIRVVLLHIGGPLYVEARSQVLQATHRLHSLRHCRFFMCQIENENDAELIQVVKVPQLRFFRSGSEVHTNVGIMQSEDIVEKVYSIEGAVHATGRYR